MVLDGVSFKALWEKAFDVPVFVGDDLGFTGSKNHVDHAGLR